MNNILGSKLYYSISEVAELTQLPPYTLRAWEKEFPCLRPRRSRGKNRAYRERDIGIVLLIKHLLYGQRYTSQGVRQRLGAQPELLRQAAADVVALLDPAACAALLAARPQEQGPQQQAQEPTAPLPAADDRPEPVGASADTPAATRTGSASPAPQLRELLRLAREELRELLRLC